MNILYCRIGREVFQFDLSDCSSPNTLEALKKFLPLKFELHYAKIAGQEVMGIAPFCAPLEHAVEVADARAGMLVYWPHRQLLCVYYGKLQDEAAHINILGFLDGDLEGFAACGEQIRTDQGGKLHYMELSLDGNFDGARPKPPNRIILDPYEREIWIECQEEILALKDRSGVMRPMGPILYGEADTRLCHEFLSLERRRIGRDPVELPAVKDALCEYLSFTEEKLSGWYGLKMAAAVADRYKDEIRECENIKDIDTLLNGFILFLGRVNMWLDALMPWNDINEISQKTRS